MRDIESYIGKLHSLHAKEQLETQLEQNDFQPVKGYFDDS